MLDWPWCFWKQLFAGSEGTLGIITEIMVSCVPLPPYSFNMVCVFKTDEEAFALPNKIPKAGADPTSLNIWITRPLS